MFVAKILARNSSILWSIEFSCDSFTMGKTVHPYRIPASSSFAMLGLELCSTNASERTNIEFIVTCFFS